MASPSSVGSPGMVTANFEIRFASRSFLHFPSPSKDNKILENPGLVPFEQNLLVMYILFAGDTFAKALQRGRGV